MAEEGISGSIVLAADEPAALAEFYGRLLRVTPLPGLSGRHWRLPWPAGGFLELYAPSRVRPQPRRSGRLAPCLQREAVGGTPLELLEHWVGEAIGLGATLMEAPRRESFGAEAWLLDPEGNRLLLLVLAGASQDRG